MARKTSATYANCRTNRSSALAFAERVLAAIEAGGIDATPVLPARNQAQPPPQPATTIDEMSHAEMDLFQRQQRNLNDQGRSVFCGQKGPTPSMSRPQDDHPRAYLSNQPNTQCLALARRTNTSLANRQTVICGQKGLTLSKASTSHGVTDHTEPESHKRPKTKMAKLSVGIAAKKALDLNESSDTDSSGEEEIELKGVSRDAPENACYEEKPDGQSSRDSPQADESIGNQCQGFPKNVSFTAQRVPSPPLKGSSTGHHRGGKSLNRMNPAEILQEQAISTLKREKKNLQGMVQSKDDEIKELRRQLANRSDPKDLVRSAIAANRQSYSAALASKDLEINHLKSDLRRAQDRAKEMNRAELMQKRVIAELEKQYQAERARVDEEHVSKVSALREHASKVSALRESYEAKYMALQAQMDLIRGFQQKSI